jgi:hypothetical protein
MTNQANRRSSAARFRLDPQLAAPLGLRFPSTRIAMLVPKKDD